MMGGDTSSQCYIQAEDRDHTHLPVSLTKSTRIPYEPLQSYQNHEMSTHIKCICMGLHCRITSGIHLHFKICGIPFIWQSYVSSSRNQWPTIHRPIGYHQRRLYTQHRMTRPQGTTRPSIIMNEWCICTHTHINSLEDHVRYFAIQACLGTNKYTPGVAMNYAYVVHLVSVYGALVTHMLSSPWEGPWFKFGYLLAGIMAWLQYYHEAIEHYNQATNSSAHQIVIRPEGLTIRTFKHVDKDTVMTEEEVIQHLADCGLT